MSHHDWFISWSPPSRPSPRQKNTPRRWAKLTILDHPKIARVKKQRHSLTAKIILRTPDLSKRHAHRRHCCARMNGVQKGEPCNQSSSEGTLALMHAHEITCLSAISSHKRNCAQERDMPTRTPGPKWKQPADRCSAHKASDSALLQMRPLRSRFKPRSLKVFTDFHAPRDGWRGALVSRITKLRYLLPWAEALQEQGIRATHRSSGDTEEVKTPHGKAGKPCLVMQALSRMSLTGDYARGTCGLQNVAFPLSGTHAKSSLL